MPKGSSVMQACDAAGVDIPRFWYHPGCHWLATAGCVWLIGKRAQHVAQARCVLCYALAPGTTILTDTDK